MADIGGISVKITADTGEFNKAMKSISETMQNVGQKMKDIGKTMTAAVTLPLAALGTAAITNVAKFDDSMAKVAAISGATGEQLLQLREQAKHLGSTTAHSASAAAEGMSFLAMAGFKVNDILSAMPGMLSLASAGQMDLARTADITSNIMTGFGIAASDAGKVADVLAKAATSANVDVGMIGETMKYTAPIAKSFGMSLEETAAIVSKMGDAGIQGSMAGTALSAALVRLADPPKEAAKALHSLGVATSDANGNMLPIKDIIAQLETGMNKLSESERLAAASSIFGQEAMKGWLPVIEQGSLSVSEFTGMLQNSAGTADEVAKKMEDSVGGSFRSLSSAIEGFFLSFEDEIKPIVRGIADAFTELTRKFSALDADTRKTILVVGALAAAAGPLLIALGAVIATIPSLIAGVKALGVAFTFLSANPIGAVIAGLGLLVAAGIYLYTNWDKIKAQVIELWNTLSATAKSIFETVKNTLTTIWGDTWNAIITTLRKSWDTLVTTFNGLGSNIRSWFSDLSKDALGWGKNLMTNFIDGFKSMFGSLRDIVSSAASTIADFLGFHSPAKKGPASDADKWIPNLVGMFEDDMQKGIPRLEARLSDMALSLNPAGYAPSFAETTPAKGGLTINGDLVINGGDGEEAYEKLERNLKRWGLI